MRMRWNRHIDPGNPLQVVVVVELMSLECLVGAGIPTYTCPELRSTPAPPHGHRRNDLVSLFRRMRVRRNRHIDPGNPLQVVVVVDLMSLEFLVGAGIPRYTCPELCSTSAPPHGHTRNDLVFTFPQNASAPESAYRSWQPTAGGRGGRADVAGVSGRCRHTQIHLS